MTISRTILDQQFEFRPGRSTYDEKMFLTRHWQDDLDEGRDDVVVALDIAGVFDKVWHQSLLESSMLKVSRASCYNSWGTTWKIEASV